MKNWLIIISFYLIPLLIIFGIYFLKRKRKHHTGESILKQSLSDGLIHAASLHPIIDPTLCIGCGSCVSACPEHNVLGLVHQQAELINPTNCIGHGACKAACPQDAIKLVFGNATRGQEIPNVSPNYETCVKGIFIAGELGGMGLIRNAIEQGRLAMESVTSYVEIINKQRTFSKEILDSVIIGAGPAGMTATLGAVKSNLNSVTIDQESKGGTIAHFPKGKIVMTQEATMPLIGKVKFGEISKEKLMVFWLGVIRRYQLIINENEELLSISQIPDGLHQVKTNRSEYISKTVILTLGRRGSPRKLGVPGEEQSKVVYRLVDASQYKGKSVLVVGGGDSALEAACSIAEEYDTDVTISYRKDNFSRAKMKNQKRIELLQNEGKLNVLFSSQVKAIGKQSALINLKNETKEIPNQAVVVCAGGILPTSLLKSIGVSVEIKYGTE